MNASSLNTRNLRNMPIFNIKAQDFPPGNPINRAMALNNRHRALFDRDFSIARIRQALKNHYITTSIKTI